MKNQHITKWLHLSELRGDPWILPIVAAVTEAYKAKKIHRLPKTIGDLGEYISIRLNMLPRIIERIKSGCEELYPLLLNIHQKYEFTPQKEGFALKIDDNLKYNLLIDIDALLFELNSCCDFMKTLLEQLYSHAGKSVRDGGQIIRRILRDKGLNTDWFIKLDKLRNLFIHDVAPYIAIDISNAPLKYELIIMKENLKIFDDPEKFLLLSELAEIVRGFTLAKPAIQENLIGIFKTL